MRTIQLIGTIDEESYKLFSRKLARLESESREDVLLELNSAGGVAMDALAFYGRIRNSPLHITVVAYGAVCSAATLIFAGCDHRSIDSEAWFMVHDDSARIRGNTALLQVEASHLEVLEDQWAELLSRHSDIPADQWRRMSRKTTYLTAKQLLQYGLADTVLKGKSRA